MTFNEEARLLYNGKHGVHCVLCGCATPPHDNQEKAIEKWNRRSDNA